MLGQHEEIMSYLELYLLKRDTINIVGKLRKRLIDNS